MNGEIIIIDGAYKYEVDDTLDGGIGFVRLMSLKEFSRKPPVKDDANKPALKYPYRSQLAAKTLKQFDDIEAFVGGCEAWMSLNEPGIVPLLKTVKHGEECLALMPRYTGSLRTLLKNRSCNQQELLSAFNQAISNLSNVYKRYGISHQDVKPENLLYAYQDHHLVFEWSDWGIAKVQAELLASSGKYRVQRLNELGILPYLAPERFNNYLSGESADIFGLGMIYFEIITGGLPFISGKDVAEQVKSREYYKTAKSVLLGQLSQQVSDLLLQMLQPEVEKRLQNYAEILAITKTLM